jgi:hypothetical protein
VLGREFVLRRRIRGAIRARSPGRALRPRARGDVGAGEANELSVSSSIDRPESEVRSTVSVLGVELTDGWRAEAEGLDTCAPRTHDERLRDRWPAALRSGVGVAYDVDTDEDEA